MVTGVLPFRADTVGRLKRCILDGSYSIPPFVSDRCRTLIKSVLQPVPADRLTVAEIRQSDWLEGQEFPEPIESFNSRSSSSSEQALADELETRRTLGELGITDGLLASAETRQARSSVTGTYRIVMHRIQRRRTEVDYPPCMAQLSSRSTQSDANGGGWGDGGVGISSRSNNNDKNSKKKSTPGNVKKESKMCTIL